MTEHPGKMIVDLDGCLAGPKAEGGDYDTCRPNVRMVKRLRELRDLGYKIAIYTSRNVRTHNSNPGLLVADTAPKIIAWLQQHDIPYDEIHVGKPWTGTVGYYVDDRALRPEEFLTHTINELVELTKGGRYEPTGSHGVRGSEQGWLLLDVRNPPTGCPLRDDRLKSAIKRSREQGWRTGLITTGLVSIPAGMDEELRRAGVVVSRVDNSADLLHAANLAFQDLTSQGVASERSPVIVVAGGELPYELPAVADAAERLKAERSYRVRRVKSGALLTHGSELGGGVIEYYPSACALDARVRVFNQPADWRKLASRHFNTVVAYDNTVHKDSRVLEVQEKLRHEYSWLKYYDDVSPNDVEEGEHGGYTMEWKRGGSLDKLLLRGQLTEEKLDLAATELSRLFNKLGGSEPIWEEDHYDRSEPNQLFNELIVDKTRQRMVALREELDRIKGPALGVDWVVNGVNLGSPANAGFALLAAIPYTEPRHWGGWHGDFCPGNVVMDEQAWYPATSRFGMKLIDPRGTINGTDTALFGDRRYDLAKLAHALRWGYDVIVEGWRDCDWVGNGDHFDVQLQLWDERVADGARTNRRQLWSRLVEQKLSVGGVGPEDPVIHALAALQLITCAPLHKEDPERMVALVARGLQAAKLALGSPKE